MPARPAVSIVLATYDRPALLRRALASIRAQTFPDWELIVIADGPPRAETLEAVAAAAAEDHRIRPVRFARNAGSPARRCNQAMALARADWVAFQDDDDLWYPGALQALLAGARADPAPDLVYGAAHLMDARTGAHVHERFGLPFDRDALERRNLFCNNAVLVARDALDAVGGYDESEVLRAFFDWDLWRRIAARGRVRRILDLLGEVWAFQPDSVGANAVIDEAGMRAHVAARGPLPLQGYWSRRPSVLFLTDRHPAALSLWRVDLLVDALRRAGSRWTVDRADATAPGLAARLAAADVVVLYRFQRKLPGLQDRRRAGLRVLYDLDDDLLAPEVGLSAAEREAVRAHLAEADAVSVSTPRLAAALDRPEAFVRPNGVPLALLDEVDRLPRPERRRFTVGWLAGPDPRDPEELVLAFARSLARRLPGAAFVWFGKSDGFEVGLRAIAGLSVLRRPYFPIAGLGEWYAALRREALDAIVAPLVEGSIDEARSPLKLIDSGALRVPLVVSPVGAYREAVRDGENALLADGPESLAAAVARLAGDAALADRLAAGARQDVRERFRIERIADRFVLDLDEALAGRPVVP